MTDEVTPNSIASVTNYHKTSLVHGGVCHVATCRHAGILTEESGVLKVGSSNMMPEASHS